MWVPWRLIQIVRHQEATKCSVLKFTVKSWTTAVVESRNPETHIHTQERWSGVVFYPSMITLWSFFFNIKETFVLLYVHSSPAHKITCRENVWNFVLLSFDNSRKCGRKNILKNESTVKLSWRKNTDNLWITNWKILMEKNHKKYVKLELNNAVGKTTNFISLYTRSLLHATTPATWTSTYTNHTPLN